ncbi:uncharacterized protein BXZ73DRAFT_107569 [Epithele typhae]|uniref:uncharacterized protein n=1 Tax=Epithele typhae TaxID=378194 RepID=UPI0020084A6F|nr:uncharacterized protein BXZ73DRAFT_107569 [Epithele typhae]KAH9912200.1 hypothetical protein BXZ73DRAFT_107569 [Epithele typhae]
MIAYGLASLGTLLPASCYLSEIINSRVAFTVQLQLWALPLLVAPYTFSAQTSQWVYFAIVSLINGFPNVRPVRVAWAPTNSSGVGMRTVSASLYNIFVQAGGIIAANIYWEDHNIGRLRAQVRFALRIPAVAHDLLSFWEASLQTREPVMIIAL